MEWNLWTKSFGRKTRKGDSARMPPIQTFLGPIRQRFAENFQAPFEICLKFSELPQRLSALSEGHAHVDSPRMAQNLAEDVPEVRLQLTCLCSDFRLLNRRTEHASSVMFERISWAEEPESIPTPAIEPSLSQFAVS